MSITARYFRCYITASNTGDYASIAEWNFLSGGSPLSRSGVTITASSFLNSGWQPAYAGDGILTTAWLFPSPSANSPQYIQFDFGANITVDSFSLTNRSDSTVTSPTNFYFGYSTDGVTWSYSTQYKPTWSTVSQVQTFTADNPTAKSIVTQTGVQVVTKNPNSKAVVTQSGLSVVTLNKKSKAIVTQFGLTVLVQNSKFIQPQIFIIT